jgi:hypothetical protein
MKKSGFRQFQFGSADYVIAHAKWRESRGKRPSAPFLEPPCHFLFLGECWITNPQAALQRAKQISALLKMLDAASQRAIEAGKAFRHRKSLAEAA